MKYIQQRFNIYEAKIKLNYVMSSVIKCQMNAYFLINFKK